MEPSHCLEEITVVVENLNELEHPDEYFVNKVDYKGHWIQLYCYSSTGWLDVLEISFIPFGTNSSYAKVCFQSNGKLHENFVILCSM